MMVTSFKITAMSSILFASITCAVALDWKTVPPNLEEQFVKLFTEFKQIDSSASSLTYDPESKMELTVTNKNPTGIMYTLVAFFTKKYYASSCSIVVLFIQQVTPATDTAGQEEVIYYLVGGTVIPDDSLVPTKLTNALETANEKVIASLNKLQPEAVLWHVGTWPDIHIEDTAGQNALTIDFVNHLRLLPISFEIARIDIELTRYGSIQSGPSTITSLVCAIYQLTKKGGYIDAQWFCVIVDKDSENMKVIYTSNPTRSVSEAFGSPDHFATNYVIWDSQRAKFDELVGKKFDLASVDSLKFLVAKLLIRKEILKNQLSTYMTEDNGNFPAVIENLIQNALDFDEDSGSRYKITGYPEKFQDILNQARQNAKDLIPKLFLKFVKSRTIVTTTDDYDTEQTFNWFEFEYDKKTYQCVARLTITKISENMCLRDLEITDIFLDKEKFSAVTKKSLMDKTTYTKSTPLYWHSPEVPVLRSKAAKLFTKSVTQQQGKIKQLIETKQIKRNMPITSYDIGQIQFASRLNLVNMNIIDGFYFEVTFSTDTPCYAFCIAQCTSNTLQFTIPDGSTLYNTKEAVIDAMETMMKEPQV